MKIYDVFIVALSFVCYTFLFYCVGMLGIKAYNWFGYSYPVLLISSLVALCFSISVAYGRTDAYYLNKMRNKGYY